MASSPTAQGTGPSPSGPSRYWSRSKPRSCPVRPSRFLVLAASSASLSYGLRLKLSPNMAERPLRLRISDPSIRISATHRTSLESIPMSEVRPSQIGVVCPAQSLHSAKHITGRSLNFQLSKRFLTEGRPVLLCGGTALAVSH